jgi:CheY-like chemotaxis protein
MSLAQENIEGSAIHSSFNLIEEADMTLSVRNVARCLFSGSSRSDDDGFAQEKELKGLSTDSDRRVKTILLVDDEPSLLSMRRSVFEALGYSVLTATCGEDALAVFGTHAVDAVVLDYLMPGMDGGETAHCMRKLRSGVPLILSSGCLEVPQRVLEIVNVAVEKAAGPEALIAAVVQQLSLLLCCPSSKHKTHRS